MCSEGEHGEGDEGLVAVEPERDAGEESDLGVRGFDEALGEAGVERGVDRGAVGAMRRWRCTNAGMRERRAQFDPSVERGFAFFAFDREHVAQSFFEEIGAPESRVGLGDPVELVALPAGEVTGVLPQRVAGLGDVFGVAGRVG